MVILKIRVHGEKTAAKLKQRRIPDGANNPSLGDEDAQKISSELV